jgi:ABC-type Fe3+/spermidine/putrescine transport system ATPase subunit
MPCVELRGVSNFICRNVELKIEDGEMLVLLGSTGAGKTTLLNIIAGLVEYEGSVLFNGVGVDGVPSNKRRIGYLFQSLALFPHLNVVSNIAFGLKMRDNRSSEVEKRVKAMLHLMGIENLSDRYPHNLSGGERQRVALGRALAPSPEVLLLDEPLSSLDYETSKYLRMEIKRVQKKLGITTIYVTHNQREGEELGDKLAIIHNGTIGQIGRPEEIFFNPVSTQISQFIGSPNILCCEYCRKLAKGLVEVKSRDLHIVVPDNGNGISKIAILPHDIYISKNKPPGPDINRFKGTIIEMKSSINLTWIRLHVGEHILLAEQATEITKELNLQVGNEAYLILKMPRIKTLAG